MALKVIFVFSLIFGLVPAITDEEYASMPELFQVDNYDTCMMLGKKAFYCSITYQLEPIDQRNPPNIWRVIKEASASELHYRHDKLHLMACIPQRCPNVRIYNETHPDFHSQLTECYNRKYRTMDLRGNVLEVRCRSNKPLYDIDNMDYIAGAIFTIYIALVLLASAYDYTRKSDPAESTKNTKPPFEKFVTAFSIPTNWNKLKSVPTGEDFDKLKSVQGIRVYMTVLVIMVHTSITFVGVPLINPRFFEQSNDNPDFTTEIPKRGIYLLSFHFMMSSWMLMISMLAKADRNEEITLGFIVKTVIKRYVRFLPSIIVIVGFYATWARHIPFGPFWEGMCEEVNRCRKNWWANILFVQNHVDRYNMCHIVSWFLAVEMQYYIISLFFIMAMVKFRNKIPVVIGIMLMVNIVFAFLDHYRHGYPSTLSGKPEETYRVVFNKKPQWHDHFASYHANAAGSIIGLGFGYFYYKYKNQLLFGKKVTVLLWWISISILMGFVFFSPFLYNIDATEVSSAVWVALSRPCFASAMGLLIIGFSQGIGGFYKWIFEWGPLSILAKLSFTVYIGHTVFQHIRVGLLWSPVHFDYFTFVVYCLADIFAGFILGLWLTLFFEMPSNELANMMFKSKRAVPKKKE
ncbi:unnamed protein product [Phaedon cochleariae]|uniref:Acyltransferase 3 domain-containing protein n=1 Tax=Phaedon cochleariae TaxID=80249 RepID=A0A9N9X3W9_PHACE|nr:unnamed protein product [Phaedon cochleariae]